MDNYQEKDYNFDDAINLLDRRDMKRKMEEEEITKRNEEIAKYRLIKTRDRLLTRDLTTAKKTIRCEALLALTTIVTGTLFLSTGLAENMGVALEALREASGTIFIGAGGVTLLHFPSTVIAKQQINRIKDELENRTNKSNLKR